MSNATIREIEVPGSPRLRVQPVEFETIQENWNEYKLPDGTKVRVKNVVLKMFLQVDEDGNPMYGETGDPIVVIMGQQLVVPTSSGD